MIVNTKNGTSINTATDLTAPERHILQKLFLWKSMVSSLNEFQMEKDKALSKGWNGSGPIKESPALKSIVLELESDVSKRLFPQY